MVLLFMYPPLLFRAPGGHFDVLLLCMRIASVVGESFNNLLSRTKPKPSLLLKHLH